MDAAGGYTYVNDFSSRNHHPLKAAELAVQVQGEKKEVVRS